MTKENEPNERKRLTYRLRSADAVYDPFAESMELEDRLQRLNIALDHLQGTQRLVIMTYLSGSAQTLAYVANELSMSYTTCRRLFRDAATTIQTYYAES